MSPLGADHDVRYRVTRQTCNCSNPPLYALSSLPLRRIFGATSRTDTGPRTWAGGTALLGPSEDGSEPASASPCRSRTRSAATDGSSCSGPASRRSCPATPTVVDDIFVRDRVTNQTTRVNVSSTGDEANGPSDYPSISADGRFVTFASAATNLVPGRHERPLGRLRPRSAGPHHVAREPHEQRRADHQHQQLFRDRRGRPLCRVHLRGLESGAGPHQNGQLYLRDRDVRRRRHLRRAGRLADHDHQRRR